MNGRNKGRSFTLILLVILNNKAQQPSDDMAEARSSARADSDDGDDHVVRAYESRVRSEER